MSEESPALDRLYLPDGTTVEEHDLVTARDVLVGDRSTVSFGIRGETVVLGDGVDVGGDIEARMDCRVGRFAKVDGSVVVGFDATIEERARIAEELQVGSDVDVGEDVEVGEGVTARGRIEINQPLPTMLFLIAYITFLMRAGEEEAAESIVETYGNLEEGEPLTVPPRATVGDDTWETDCPAVIGADCRIHGNIRAESITVGDDTEIFGSLRAADDIHLPAGTTIHGDVRAESGRVTLTGDAHVRGDVHGETVAAGALSVVEGVMRASEDIELGGVGESIGRDDTVDEQSPDVAEAMDDELTADAPPESDIDHAERDDQSLESPDNPPDA